ncbi:mandelate racemase/muconate lactonizing enzyme family protein [Streptomyces tsukubensis]|uniref:Mandelate racemase n=1 Tax=Streptomyces tsukubensis TaxID=83656 RepID=A0A1V4A1P4_9ACTN|nr:mandelate racemase/muconate lactonizing enzyme family protein [Streptomyces tsukubensis]OON73420.1 mandelate racemase [Streptomyces tsukubensis]QFR96787.1 mandelate racemase/muconate lactonizing enzyme family protein [Streptomyces tsukubensis]
MSIITKVDIRLVNIEPEVERTDASQTFVRQETVLATIETADGLRGTGYSYTIGTGGSSVVALLRDHLAATLLGADARAVEALWTKMLYSTRATAFGVVTALAMAALDTALWDLRCLRAGEPLWRLAGGAHSRLPVYDTEGGWLQLPIEELVENAKASKAAGLRGAKFKVGKPSAAEDAERLTAVRAAVGDEWQIMVDANQSMTGAEAIRRARTYEPLDIAWFEEPLPAEDVAGHERLARSTTVPVAVGESIYSVGHFAEYLRRGAAGIVQVDVARVGGITPWLKVAHTAEAFNVRVAPHFLMEIHASLACAVPAGMYVEHIPQLGAITRSALTIEDGCVVPPESPGLGIEWDEDAIADLRVA